VTTKKRSRGKGGVEQKEKPAKGKLLKWANNEPKGSERGASREKGVKSKREHKKTLIREKVPPSSTMKEAHQITNQQQSQKTRRQTLVAHSYF